LPAGFLISAERSGTDAVGTGRASCRAISVRVAAASRSASGTMSNIVDLLSRAAKHFKVARSSKIFFWRGENRVPGVDVTIKDSRKDHPKDKTVGNPYRSMAPDGTNGTCGARLRNQ